MLSSSGLIGVHARCFSIKHNSCFRRRCGAETWFRSIVADEMPSSNRQPPMQITQYLRGDLNFEWADAISIHEAPLALGRILLHEMRNESPRFVRGALAWLSITITATLTCCGARVHFDLDCHSPSTPPVGSRMKLSQPMPFTSVTSFMTSAPNDFAFFVAARMSSTST